MAEMRVSHETIYLSLFVQGRGELRKELTRCLRTGRAVRRHRDQREGVANYETMRVKYQALNEKLKHGELNGRLMDADTAIETGTAAQAIYFAMLDRLAVDFPGRLAGRTAAEIKHEVDGTLKKIREAVEKEFESRANTARARLETERKQEELLKV